MPSVDQIFPIPHNLLYKAAKAGLDMDSLAKLCYDIDKECLEETAHLRMPYIKAWERSKAKKNKLIKTLAKQS
jgi:hypothetical protein